MEEVGVQRRREATHAKEPGEMRHLNLKRVAKGVALVVYFSGVTQIVAAAAPASFWFFLPWQACSTPILAGRKFGLRRPYWGFWAGNFQ